MDRNEPGHVIGQLSQEPHASFLPTRVRLRIIGELAPIVWELRYQMRGIKIDLCILHINSTNGSEFVKPNIRMLKDKITRLYDETYKQDHVF
jgi:hypothetical protein